MAFNKFANASVVTPHVSMPAWDEVRAHSMSLAPSFNQKAASKVVLEKYDPGQYLLSHCTIIASVDTDSPGLPLGQQMVEGVQIDRRYSDFYIAPRCSKFVNNNNDAWERKLLMACFRTFIGGENYVEHLQIPELSKGKIIDAAARDIGDSVYVDILVATDRKHKPLITAVESRQLQTLSMGCQVGFTICTKCGNRAEDETQLCKHIRYMKGNHFLDGLGQTRKIAELCGHINEEPGSVKFIEASWVANPAFTGAVLRDILTPAEQHAYQHRVQVAFAMPPRVADPNAYAKAAKLNTTSARAQDKLLAGLAKDLGTVIPKTFQATATGPRFDVAAFEEPSQEQFPGAGEGGASSEKKDTAFDKAVSDLAEALREKAIQKVREEMTDPGAPRADLSENQNDTLVRQAIVKNAAWRGVARFVVAQTKDPKLAMKFLRGLVMHKQGGWQAVKSAGEFSSLDCLAISRMLDVFHQTPRLAGESRIYRTVCAVGGVAAYENESGFLAACRRHLGRQLTGSEEDALLTKGRIYDLGS